ncbi:MAG TPA: disulfide bond formation protein B [Rhodospirillaceae bacterium]|nr:disulfide bond formation protein B [Rhodospirillaceae bacterium]HAA91855.1 disulfide bond formation protein B [Rhodospirillaceae bacterium]HAT36229.1 disulfide bond formation protein B [Rhodospirillaceae bacterium]|tara:strand:+ start:835 stop:1329 length:495 start_codon:yes stop_codon:yes gene_type:complete
MAVSVDKPNLPLQLILLATIIVLGGAYGSQYFGDLHPCKLCLYQRWPWWIAGGLALTAILLPSVAHLKSRLMILVGLVLIVGSAIAVYHVGVEFKWWQGPATCSGNIELPKSLSELHATLQRAPVVRCDEVSWSLFGISMAGYNALISASAGIFSLVVGTRTTK